MSKRLIASLLLVCTPFAVHAQDIATGPGSAANAGEVIVTNPPPGPANTVQQRSELAAIIGQYGSGNVLALIQSGAENHVQLEQNGDRNTMTAVQIWDGNRLDWRQLGSDLPDLGIVQTGSMQISVVQTAN